MNSTDQYNGPKEDDHLAAAAGEESPAERGERKAQARQAVKRYLLLVLIPAIAIVALANWLIPNPSKKDAKAYISKALASGNDRIAEKEYESLSRMDVNNVAVHRGYINVHYSLPKHQGKNKDRDNSGILRYYTALADSNTARTADVGRYCLGLIRSLEDDPNGALAWYLKVGNLNLPYLNNSIGYCYKELGEPEKAKQFFRREIELGGYVTGAVSNLAEMLLGAGDTKGLHALLDDKRCTDKVSLGVKRQLAFLDADPVAYFQAVLTYYRQYTAIDGVVAAILICAIWLIFIKRLDIFEPESFRSIFVALFISIVFSEITSLLYDLAGLTGGFEMGRSPLHQLAYCIFGIGLIEESVKLVPVFIILLFTRNINESTDYIIYASVSALGFALMENIGYFGPYGLDAIATRAFSATLLHMAMSSIAIYGLVYARYRRKSLAYFALSFSAACAIHGIYDWLLTVEYPLDALRPGVLLLLLLAITLYARIFRNALSTSEFFTDAGRQSLLGRNAFLLVCGLSYVVLVQYLIISLRFGPDFANRRFAGSIFGAYIILVFVVAGFSRIKLKRALWLPILSSESARKKMSSSMPTDAEDK